MAEMATPEKPVGKEEPPPEQTHRVGRRITNEPKISRRGFLALMGIGAEAAVLDSLLSHIPNAPSLSKAFWEQLETATLGVSTEQLKKEVEDRFQVEIVGPSTGVRAVGTFGPRLGEQYPTVEWDSPRLKGLIGALSELPPHFYLPRMVKGQEHKARFVLTNVPITKFGNAWRGGYQGGFCDCSSAEEQTIVLDKKHLDQTILGAGHGREAWFHEITHALTTPETAKYVQAVCMPIGIQTIDDLREIFFSELTVEKRELKGVYISGYGHELTKDENNRLLTLPKPDERARELTFIGGNRLTVQKSDLLLLGEEYIKKELAKFVRKSHPEITTLEEYLSDPPGLGKAGIGTVEVSGMNQALGKKSKIGYGARNFSEFFSVAAEYYLKGRDEFVRTYEPFLGKERAEKLYAGMKQEIFRGKEY